MQERRASKSFISVSILIGLALSIAPSARAQSVQEGSDRKVVTRVEPAYPETLKRLYIGGAVRVEIVVAANGSVESTELLGGNPVLGQSAMKAIKQWKYAPAKAQEKFVVKMEFDPHE